MDRAFVAGAVTGLVLALTSPADAAFGRAREGAVTFLAVVRPAGLRIEGKTSEISVSEEGGAVRFVVPLAKLDTGIELRNRHMRDKYLEVGRFPNAELAVPRAALKLPAEGQEASGTAAGTFTIHGQSRPVQVSYAARRAGATFQVSGSVRLNINDFGIDVPTYLGVTVKPDVDVTVHAKVDDV